MNDVPEIALGVEANNGGYAKWLLFFGVVFIGCMAMLVFALQTGSAEVPWAFLTANFVFLLGVSQFGASFTAMMRVIGAKWARPYYRLGEIVTLAYMPIAIGGLLVIYYFGRHDLFYWLEPAPGEHLSAWLNETFLLTRNLVALIVFYVLVAVSFVYGLLPDVTQESATSGPRWRRAMYRRLLKMKTARDTAKIKRFVYFYSPLILLTCAVTSTFIAWDFGMMLTPHYHSTVYPMYFIVGNMFAGTALLLLLSVLLRRVVPVGDYFSTLHVKSLGIMLTGFSLLWLYFFWAQFFVSWFGNLPQEYGPLWKQMHGFYGPYFWVMLSCIVAIPIGTMIFAWVKRSWWAMVIVTLIMTLGIWINRFLMVISTLYDEYTPFASIPDYFAFAGIFAGFLMILLFLFNVFPMISMWELRDAGKPEHDSVE